MGFATEPFKHPRATRALKVLDCPNSHPTTYRGYWQRECDLWSAGDKVPIPQWMFSRMNRELQTADLVLCPSAFVRDTMVTNGIPETKCFVNPFGVDVGIFTPRESLPPKPRFISVGTICLRKGHQYLFRAFELVKKELPDAELICVGQYKCDFDRERPLWQGKFTHYPSVTHPELAKILKTCSAFVLASLEEGFARVLSEAMASGLPIIATYESGATTLIQDGREGFIVPSGNANKIAEAMLKLARDPEANKRMGEAAYRKGAVRNTWQDYGDRCLERFESAMKQRAAAKKP